MNNLRKLSSGRFDSRRLLLITLVNAGVVGLNALTQARWLGPTDRGILVILLTVISFGGILGSFGYGIARTGHDPIVVNLPDLGKLMFASDLLATLMFFSFSISQKYTFSIGQHFFILVVASTNLILFLLNDLLFSIKKTYLYFKMIFLSIGSLELFVTFVLYQTDNLSLESILISIITINLLILIPVFFLVKPYIAFESSGNFLQIIKSWKSISIYLFILQFVYVYRLPASYVLTVEDLAKISVSLSVVFIGMPLIHVGSQYFRQAGNRFTDPDSISLLLPIQVLLGLILIASGIFVSADYFVRSVLGTSYLECALQIRLLSFGVPIFAISIFAISFKLGRRDNNVTKLCLLYTLTNFGFVILIFELFEVQDITLIILGEMIYAGIVGFFVLLPHLNFRVNRF